MSKVGQYLISIMSAAVIVSIISLLFDKKDITGTVVRMICGILFTVTVIAPIKDFRIQSLQGVLYDKKLVESAVSDGKAVAREMFTEHIMQQTEAYILKKANDLNAQITVEVILAESEDAVPIGVVLEGPVSPYAKTALQEYIAQDLGISKEHQVWN